MVQVEASRMDAADIELIVRTPDELSPAERSAFIALVVEGGEVAGVGLETNVANARVLILLTRGGDFVGCAALKRPQGTYRKKLIKKSGTDLGEDAFPFELGYIFVREAVRRRGQSHRLVEAALARADNAAVFATVRTENSAMQRTLAKAEFKSAATYPGRNDRPITLFVRPVRQL